MNKLTQQYIDDVLPYLKPERREGHKKGIIEDVRLCGEIVRIENERSRVDGTILVRNYYHENGAMTTLTAIHAGVDSLPELESAI
jgi:hypothetical protein